MHLSQNCPFSNKTNPHLRIARRKFKQPGLKQPVLGTPDTRVRQSRKNSQDHHRAIANSRGQTLSRLSLLLVKFCRFYPFFLETNIWQADSPDNPYPFNERGGDRADQKLFWRGPTIFGRARSLVRFLPPYVLHPPISRPN